MVCGPYPLLNSVRDALGSLESGLRRASKNLEFNSGDKKRARVADETRIPWSSSITNPIKSFPGALDGEKKKAMDGQCANYLQLGEAWSLLVHGFVQAIAVPFKSSNKCSAEHYGQEVVGMPHESPSLVLELKGSQQNGDKCEIVLASKKEDFLSIELLLGYVSDHLAQNLQMFGQRCKKSNTNSCREPLVSDCGEPSRFDHLEFIRCFEEKKADVDLFLANIGIARVGGGALVGVASAKGECEFEASNGSRKGPVGISPQKITSGFLNMSLSNVERLRSTLSAVSWTELVELIPQLRRSSKEHPDKEKLFSVQDFFRYTEAEGRRFFEELDRDGDGQVTLEDLEIAMKKRRLPRKYAREFLCRTRKHLFSKSIGWKQFLSLMEQKEPTILRAYTTLRLSKSGTLQKHQILASLRNAGLPANEDNAIAMMRNLNADARGSISYSHFRNFMLLLPSECLEDDPRNIWFEAATVVSVSPPVEIAAGGVLKSALAGGLACALSTSVMHPLDTMKASVQASTLSFPEVVSKLPQIGLQGLYRGSIPAILGQFSSHGLRTGIFEASKLLLTNVSPTLPEIQVQSLASFCSTILGTAVRIPCEVLKQRLQAGIFHSMGEAIVGTLHQDGIQGFVRGTGATLCREVPFYVAGMSLYAEGKKAAQNFLRRDLEPWETIVVGALSGGVAAVVTTPFDVMKTRMMTAPQGLPVSMQMVAVNILRQEGLLGLFKGAVPRFFWIAPLGAMNFAGYELARKAMDRAEHAISEQ
ncbi:uncharacterized protein [Elaeis guineensis]|uniref:uncharacterized protein isoform X1 n=1 Tax=Elaeis guineensis var. tenera TaxID=51953 RepID=UPI003C6D0FD8